MCKGAHEIAVFKGGLLMADLKELTRRFIDEVWNQGKLDLVEQFVAPGTHKGALMGIPPTGKRVSVAGTVITHFRDGKQVESWANYDQLGMLQQLGVAPSM